MKVITIKQQIPYKPKALWAQIKAFFSGKKSIQLEAEIRLNEESSISRKRKQQIFGKGIEIKEEVIDVLPEPQKVFKPNDTMEIRDNYLKDT